MRFMNPHLRLCSRLSRQQFIFSSESNRSFLTKERGGAKRKRRINIFDRVRNVTNLWRFALIVSLFGEEKITLWSLVVKRPRYYKSPCDNCAVPTVYPALCTSRKGGIRSSRATWSLRYNKICPLRDNLKFPIQISPFEHYSVQIPPLHLEKVDDKPWHQRAYLSLILIRKDDKQSFQRREKRKRKRDEEILHREDYKGRPRLPLQKNREIHQVNVSRGIHVYKSSINKNVNVMIHRTWRDDETMPHDFVGSGRRASGGVEKGGKSRSAIGAADIEKGGGGGGGRGIAACMHVRVQLPFAREGLRGPGKAGQGILKLSR